MLTNLSAQARSGAASPTYMLRRLPAVMLLMAELLVLAGCGGHDHAPAATAPLQTQGDAQAQRLPRARALSAPLSGGGAVMPHQAPEVVHLAQVSAKRVDRTRFDYVLVLHVRGAGQHIRDGVFTVASTASATQVVDGVARAGTVNAERLVVLADTITVRHDRSVPFDLAKLVFSFEGRFADTVAPAGDLQIGAVSFYVEGGRPGHEGGFKSNDSDPLAGQQVQLNAVITGDVTRARYELLDTTGRVLQDGALARLWAHRDDHTALLTVPAQPFAIRVHAQAASGAPVTWTSDPYTPRLLSAAWVPRSGAAFRHGDRLDGELRVTATPAGQGAEVRLLLPPGFTADRVQWQVPAGAAAQRLPVQVQTPASGPAGTFYDVLVSVSTGTGVAPALFTVPVLGW